MEMQNIAKINLAIEQCRECPYCRRSEDDEKKFVCRHQDVTNGEVAVGDGGLVVGVVDDACVDDMAVGGDVPVAVRLGGADYLPGGATEEDAVEACRMLEQAKVDLLDLSGGMCGFVRQGHPEPGYFGTMTEKIKAQVSIPVLLTGGVTTTAEAETLLQEGKGDLIGVGRALFRDPDWRNNQTV